MCSSPRDLARDAELNAELAAEMAADERARQAHAPGPLPSREWAPAIEASGVRRPARIYDLRSTFASNALAASVSVFELARLMGTSVAMIERHYGAMLDGSGADIARRLSAYEATQADEERAEDG